MITWLRTRGAGECSGRAGVDGREAAARLGRAPGDDGDVAHLALWRHLRLAIPVHARARHLPKEAIIEGPGTAIAGNTWGLVIIKAEADWPRFLLTHVVS